MKRLGHPLGLFKNLVDKIVFAVAAILGLQIPNFMGQYRQRLGGHFDEATQNLKGYESIAEETISSIDLSALAAHYQAGVPELKLLGNKLADDITRTDRLGSLVEQLQNAGIFGRLKHLFVDLERSIARSTLQEYQPGLPITPEAIMYALVFGLVATLFFNWLLFLFGSITNTYGDKRNHQGYKIRQQPDAQTKELLRGAEEPPVIFYEDSSEQDDHALNPTRNHSVKSVRNTFWKRRPEQISENIRQDLNRELENQDK